MYNIFLIIFSVHETVLNQLNTDNFMNSIIDIPPSTWE